MNESTRRTHIGTKKYYSRNNRLVAEEVLKSLRNGFRIVWETSFTTDYGKEWAQFIDETIKAEQVSIEWSNTDNYWKLPRTATITPRNPPTIARNVNCGAMYRRCGERGAERETIGKEALLRLKEHFANR